MSVQRENKMGVMPINKLLVSMSAPMMLSMLIQALYNIVDSVFVSFISENALTAVSLAFPAQNLLIAVAVGTGVGINALLSKKLGEKDFDGANNIATHGVFLALCSYLLFLIAGVFFSRTFFAVQTTVADIVDKGNTYLIICMVGSVAVFVQVMFERLMQSTGKTLYVMYSQGFGAIINIIFDPILIFGKFGFPKMGIAGAAVATVFGQLCGMTLAIILHHKLNHEVRLKLKGFMPCKHTIKQIYIVALPSIIMQSIGSVMVFGFNKILIKFTETAATVFGVYFKIQSFVFMPVFGLNNGAVPIVSYNYGAKNRKRITKTIKLSAIYAVSIMLVGLAVVQLFTKPLLLAFNASPNMLKLGIPALRIISLSFVFAGAGIVMSSAFQAMGQAYKSTLMSLVRQIVVILPVAYLLSLTNNVNLVWFAFPIAEIVSIILCIVFYIDLYKKVIKNL